MRNKGQKGESERPGNSGDARRATRDQFTRGKMSGLAWVCLVTGRTRDLGEGTNVCSGGCVSRNSSCAIQNSVPQPGT
jgi:hypothetical protein